ncbi:MAG: tRNA cyclic N6-threonylcarbamoyladenosine(37) synthase TcdA [Pseudomonadota bacterium]
MEQPTNTVGADTTGAFAALARLYGDAALEHIKRSHCCVVGIGGVGSWVAETLARSAVGSITIIDHDDIAPSNINRQVHADTGTVDKSKVDVMAARIRAINPHCNCHAIDDMLVPNNIEKYIDQRYDYVIDAIDTVRSKVALIYHCRRNAIPVITVGGAGGRTDPTRVAIADLNKTNNDSLAAKVRKRLRAQHGWTRNPARRFGVECVFSDQQPMFPQGDGTVGQSKPVTAGTTLDCNTGYGSFIGVTAAYGLVAASRVLEKLAAKAGDSQH